MTTHLNRPITLFGESSVTAQAATGVAKASPVRRAAGRVRTTSGDRAAPIGHHDDEERGRAHRDPHAP